MTNHEMLKSKNLEELGRWLCNHIDDCGQCPFSDWCAPKRNGAVEWLKEETKDD